LPDILGRVRRDKPRSQLDLEKIAKISNKVGFRQGITIPETAKIGLIEEKQLHTTPG